MKHRVGLSARIAAIILSVAMVITGVPETAMVAYAAQEEITEAASEEIEQDAEETGKEITEGEESSDESVEIGDAAEETEGKEDEETSDEEVIDENESEEDSEAAEEIADEDEAPEEELLEETDEAEVALNEMEAGVEKTGTAENLTWTLYSDKSLVIEGTGEFSTETSSSKRIKWLDIPSQFDADVPEGTIVKEDIVSIKVKVTGIKDMSYMFYGLTGTKSIDFTGSDTSAVTSMRDMFTLCKSLTAITWGSGFKTDNVVDMNNMFANCNVLTSLDLSKFNTSKVQNMRQMFVNCESLKTVNLSGLDTHLVTDMYSMFAGCQKLEKLDLSTWKTGQVTDMGRMFNNCKVLTSLTFGSKFNTSNVKSMHEMFWACGAITTLDLSSFNTAKVTDMGGMFKTCEALTTLNISSFNTSSVGKMDGMFQQASSLKSLDLSHFDVKTVSTMQSMFYGCLGLTSLNISGWDTSAVKSFDEMFVLCNNLKTIDVSSFDTQQATSIGSMFKWCSKLESLNMSNWDLCNLSSSSYATADVFTGCTALSMISTPISVAREIELPNGDWLDAEGNKYTKIAADLTNTVSVTLKKGVKPPKYYTVKGIADSHSYIGESESPKTRSYTAQVEEGTQYWYYVAVDPGYELKSLSYDIVGKRTENIYDLNKIKFCIPAVNMIGDIQINVTTGPKSYKITSNVGNYFIGTLPNPTNDSIELKGTAEDSVSFYVTGKSGYEVAKVTYTVGGKDKGELVPVDGKYTIPVGAITADVKIIVNTSNVWTVSNEPGNYTIKTEKCDFVEALSAEQGKAYQTLAYTFSVKPNADYVITGIKYKVGTGALTTVPGQKVDAATGTWTVTLPAGTIKANTVITVSTAAAFKINKDQNLSLTLTNAVVKKDAYVADSYRILGKDTDKLTFTVKSPEITVPVVTVGTGVGSLALKYTKITDSGKGTYTYNYECTLGQLAEGKVLGITSEEVSVRKMYISYDENQVDLKVRIGARYLQEKQDDVLKYYEIPAGQSITLIPKAKANCKVTGVMVNANGNLSAATLKLAAEVAYKPLESNVSLSIKSTGAVYAELYLKKGLDNTLMKAEKNTYTLNPEDTFFTNLRVGGEANFDQNTEVQLYNGSTRLSEDYIKYNGEDFVHPDESFSYYISPLRDFAGKTLTLKYVRKNPVSGATSTTTMKLAVRGGAEQVTSIKIGKKTSVTQAVGTTVTYTANISPANVNKDNIYAFVRTNGVSLKNVAEGTPTKKQFLDKGRFIVYLAPRVAEDVKVEFYYKGGEKNHEYEDVSDYLLGAITIKAAKSVYTASAPTVNVAAMTDKSAILSLALPKAVNAEVQYMFYEINAKAVLPVETDEVAEPMLTEKRIYVPVRAKSQSYALDLAEEGTPQGAGKVQKYNITVKLVLTETNPLDDEDMYGVDYKYAESKTKTIAVTTKNPAYASSLTVTKKTTSFYAGQIPTMADQRVLVAVVKYDANATFRTLTAATECTAEQFGEVKKAFDVVTVDRGGTTEVYLRLAEGINGKNIAPGTYKLNLTSYVGDSELTPKTTAISYTIKNPICSFDLNTPNVTLYKAVKKAATVSPSISGYTGYNSTTPPVKKVTWSVECDDPELKAALSINKKNGKVTLNKNYVLPYGVEPTFTIVAKAADYANNNFTAVKTITLKSEAQKPASICVENMEGTAILNNKGSIVYGSDLLGARVVVRDAKGNVMDTADMAFKSSIKSVTVGKDGTVFFTSTKKKGSATITATTTDGSKYSIKLSFTVK